MHAGNCLDTELGIKTGCLVRHDASPIAPCLRAWQLLPRNRPVPVAAVASTCAPGAAMPKCGVILSVRRCRIGPGGNRDATRRHRSALGAGNTEAVFELPLDEGSAFHESHHFCVEWAGWGGSVVVLYKADAGSGDGEGVREFQAGPIRRTFTAGQGLEFCGASLNDYWLKAEALPPLRSQEGVPVHSKWSP